MIKSVRSSLKHYLPEPIRVVIRRILHYFQRLFRWPIILWQVRGNSVVDQLVLIQSALASPLIALRDLQKWQDPILLRDAVVNVPGVGVFTLRALTDDLWHVLPWREYAISNLIRNQLNSGDVFIDAGANIGIYTVLASRLVGPSGRVISVEMMPDTADRLESHIQMNQLENVSVFRNALCNTVGESIVATVQSGKHGQATVAPATDRFGKGYRIGVLTTTLDAITQNVHQVRLMKIDVEGAEHIALQGAKTLLPKLDAVVYESWGRKRSAVDPVDELLIDAGYRLSQVDGNNWMAQRTSKP